METIKEQEIMTNIIEEALKEVKKEHIQKEKNKEEKRKKEDTIAI
jgi:hypothetical protein